MVDNTFATPLRQKPLSVGADIVVHSATKFLAGHSDVLLGALVVSDAQLWEELKKRRDLEGSVPGAFEAWLALRGMRTLGVRNVWLYVLVGAVAWLAVLKSGVHPTIAGVVLGLMTPARPWIAHDRLAEIMQTTVVHLETGDREAAQARLLARAEFAARET